MKLNKETIETLNEYYININVEKNKNVYLTVINKLITIV